MFLRVLPVEFPDNGAGGQADEFAGSLSSQATLYRFHICRCLFHLALGHADFADQTTEDLAYCHWADIHRGVRGEVG